MLESRPVDPIRSQRNCQTTVRGVKEGTSAPLVQSGLSEKWWREATKCFWYLRHIQVKLADRMSPYERRFGTPFDCAVTPTKDKSRLHQSTWYTMLQGKFIGYALNSGGGRTGGLIITDWHDTENIIASEVHVESFKFKVVGIKKLQNAFIFPCADGFPRQEGHTPRQSSRRQRVESFHAERVPSAFGNVQ